MKQKGVAHIALIIILLTGIVVGVYLIKQKGFFTFRSKAEQPEILNALELTDQDGNPLECNGAVTPITCTTSTLYIKVKMKNKSALTPDSGSSAGSGDTDNGSEGNPD